MCEIGMAYSSRLLKRNTFFLQVIKRCNNASIASVYDIMEMEDAQRNELLQMDGGQMYVLSLLRRWVGY